MILMHFYVLMKTKLGKRNIVRFSSPYIIGCEIDYDFNVIIKITCKIFTLISIMFKNFVLLLFLLLMNVIRILSS